MANNLIREAPPLREYWIATAPNGHRFRWSSDELQAANVLGDLTDEDAVPGGYKQFQATLPRKPGIDYGDMRVGTHIEGFTAGGMPAGEYRLERAPRNVGDYMTMDPAAYGYQGLLSDNEAARGIPIGIDLGQLQAPSQARQVAWRGSNFHVEGPTVVTDPSGFTPVAKMAVKGPIGQTAMEVQIDAGEGNKISRVHFNLTSLGLLPNASDASNVGFLLTSDDDAQTVNSSVVIADITPGGNFDVTFSPRRWVSFTLYRTTTGGAENVEYGWQISQLAFFDDSGIPVQGGTTWAALGVLASDVIARGLARWVPGIQFTTGPKGTIKPTTSVIRDLEFRELGPFSEWIKQANRFDLAEWAVWDKKTFYLNGRGEREGRRRWRTRVRPSKLKDTGAQMDRVHNQVVVQFNDVDSRTLYIGPPGSGLPTTSALLVDTDPENPLNQNGETRCAKLVMKGNSTFERAAEAGSIYLQLSKELDSSGSAELTGYVEDEHGALWPYTVVRSGDLIDFLDASIPGYRYIINVVRNRGSRTATVTLDTPKDAMDAMLEEMDAVLEPYGL